MAFCVILRNAVVELVVLFGPFALSGLLLSFPSRWMNQVFSGFFFPRVGLYLFGFIGIPMHEFSHLFFCKVFFHQVQKVKWFDPEAKSTQGSVIHAYNRWNPYHRLGHFFIGLGPAILTPIALAIVFWILIPAGRPLIAHGLKGHLGSVQIAALALEALVNRTTVSTPLFYLFLYLATCITSQVELSSDDIRQAALGLVPLFLLLLLINTFAWATGLRFHQRALELAAFSSGFVGSFLALALTLAIVNLVIFGSLIATLNLFTGRHR